MRLKKKRRERAPGATHRKDAPDFPNRSRSDRAVGTPGVLSLRDLNVTMEPVRVSFVTFHKSGSQWVRDVLTDPELLEPAGLSRTVTGINHFLQPWIQQPDHTFTGPIYGASPDQWEAASTPEDRAVIVLRDPRDIVVSWADSITYSHVDSPIVELLRDGLTRLDRPNRIRFGIAQFRFSAYGYRRWATRPPHANEYRTTYEALAAPGSEEFHRIVRFLGWPVSSEQVSRVAERHSFFARSGRRPGETDIHSHHRRGVAGDWKNHFDFELGEIFERVLPGLVAAAGYEASNDWYRNLPARSVTDTPPASPPATP
jgi:hypothetical protein